MSTIRSKVALCVDDSFSEDKSQYSMSTIRSKAHIIFDLPVLLHEVAILHEYD